MAGKKRTTFAKMNREQKLREKRVEKEMRKEAKKLEETEEEPVPTHAANLDLMSGVVEINPDGSVTTS
jgi:hypothetical protein